MTEATNAEIDPQMLTAARQSGASDLFVMLAAVDPSAVHVDQNHVTQRLARACDGYDPAAYTAAIEREAGRWGDFMTAVWDGDLAEALYHADTRNTKLLVRLLDYDVLLSALAADRGSVESAEAWLDPVVERYGWDAE